MQFTFINKLYRPKLLSSKIWKGTLHESFESLFDNQAYNIFSLAAMCAQISYYNTEHSIWKDCPQIKIQKTSTIKNFIRILYRFQATITKKFGQIYKNLKYWFTWYATAIITNHYVWPKCNQHLFLYFQRNIQSVWF